MSDARLPFESILKRDRVVVFVALILVTGLSWMYLVDMARDMANMDMGGMDMSGMDMSSGESMDMAPAEGMAESADPPMDMSSGDAMSSDGGMGESMGEAMAMTEISRWTAGYFVMMFLMWAIMMVGMMVPSATPMILTYASMVRKNQKVSPYVATGAFTAGYLLAWTAFSLVATLLQWGLDSVALLSPMMVTTSPVLGGGILIVAGVYQLTPYKNVCLTHCRHPVQYFMQHWRKGAWGALRMGLHHGTFCIGCCWFLMMILFFGGVMNLVWIAAITLFVLAEKIVPRGELFAKATAPLLILIGTVVLVVG